MSITAVPIAPVKRGYLVWLWIGIAAAVLAGVGLAWKGTAAVVADTGSNAQFLAFNGGQKGVTTTASGLQYKVLTKGNGGPTPTNEDLVLVNYKGTLRDGTVFDESRQPTPMDPTQVVPGFGEAVKLMPKGAKYRFWIKPELAYGSTPPIDPRTGQPGVPADALLIFDVELVDFVPKAVVQQMEMQRQMQMQMQQGGQGTPAPGAPGGR